MTPRRKISATLMLALAAAAAPAFAQVIEEVRVTPTTREYYYYTPDRSYHYTAPGEEVVVTTEPPIVVTEPLTEDEAINNEVIDVLASDPRLSGSIDVATHRNTVTLSGRVGSAAEAHIAQHDAASVPGVAEVNNALSPQTRILR